MSAEQEELNQLKQSYSGLATDYGTLQRKFVKVCEQLDEIKQRARQPLICKVLGHRWKITHMLQKNPWSQEEKWVYYAHTCTRCWYEEKRSFWPSL